MGLATDTRPVDSKRRSDGVMHPPQRIKLASLRKSTDRRNRQRLRDHSEAIAELV
jgi:hypothetical protein